MRQDLVERFCWDRSTTAGSACLAIDMVIRRAPCVGRGYRSSCSTKKRRARVGAAKRPYAVERPGPLQPRWWQWIRDRPLRRDGRRPDFVKTFQSRRPAAPAAGRRLNLRLRPPRFRPVYTGYHLDLRTIPSRRLRDPGLRKETRGSLMHEPANRPRIQQPPPSGCCSQSDPQTVTYAKVMGVALPIVPSSARLR